MLRQDFSWMPKSTTHQTNSCCSQAAEAHTREHSRHPGHTQPPACIASAVRLPLLPALCTLSAAPGIVQAGCITSSRHTPSRSSSKQGTQSPMPGAVESFVETDRSYLSNDSGSARDDGCTAVTAVLLGQKLIIANVGDSRAVLSRAGHGTLFDVLAACSGSPGPGLATVPGSFWLGTGSFMPVRGREGASSVLVRQLLDRMSSETRSSGEGPYIGSNRQGGTHSAEAHAQPCHRPRLAVSGGGS